MNDHCENDITLSQDAIELNNHTNNELLKKVMC